MLGRTAVVHAVWGKTWVWRLGLVAGTVLLGLWLCQVVIFPHSREYQDLIRTAERVEVRAFFIHQEDAGEDFLVLTDPADLAELSASFRITGWWVPVDLLLANSYRIRVFHKNDTRDIIIRAFDRIRHGALWHATVDPRLLSTIETLVRKKGREMPNWRAMMDNMRRTAPE
jgi:hypothetical protein